MESQAIGVLCSGYPGNQPRVVDENGKPVGTAAKRGAGSDADHNDATPFRFKAAEHQPREFRSSPTYPSARPPHATSTECQPNFGPDQLGRLLHGVSKG